MHAVRAMILLALVVILGTPMVMRHRSRSDRAVPAGSEEAARLIVVTPHVEQIREEFARGFDRWHRRRFGQGVRFDYRTPGGTTEIRKQLEAQTRAAVEAGRGFTIVPPSDLRSPDRDGEHLPEVVLEPGAIECDLFFGGGSFEHTGVKQGLILDTTVDGRAQRVRARISAPPGPRFSSVELDRTFGENRVGIENLYDPDQYWFGAALSGFGIVFNRPVLRDLELPEPRSFADLCDPRYQGLVAMSDPRQSGSVATLYDAILNREGWDQGWRILREMSANARHFDASSTGPPMDVSQGDSAAGVAVDFYGRGQAQAVLRAGQDPARGRVGYVDPPGAVYIDADPITIINGAPHPEIARRFVEFCMSDEGQALWQFPPRTDPASAQNPVGDGGEPLGPAQYRLRRMPVKRSFFEKYHAYLTDQGNPFEIASTFPRRGWRDAIGPLMGAFGIDTSEECRAAWRALQRARHDPYTSPDRLEEMETLFYAMPDHELEDANGRTMRLGFNEQNYRAIAADTDRWRDPVKGVQARIRYTTFFRENYLRIIGLSRGSRGQP